MEHLEMDTDNLTLHTIIHYTLQTARCKLYIAHCTLYTAILQCTLQV